MVTKNDSFFQLWETRFLSLDADGPSGNREEVHKYVQDFRSIDIAIIGKVCYSSFVENAETLSYSRRREEGLHSNTHKRQRTQSEEG